MKILITGAAGFIGSNLANRLQHNNELYGFDDFSTGSMENLEGVKIKMIDGIEDVNVDLIFHLGIPSSTPIYRNDRYKIVEAIKVSIDVFELAKKNKDCKIVYASSSSLYNGNAPPFKEDMEIKAMDFYTEARYLIERLAKLYYDFYGVVSIGLRFFSVYGPNERRKGEYANLVTQFIDWVHNDEQPIIYGDGKQTRDFTYVKDIVEAFVKASEYASRHKKADVFNVGAGRCYTLNELVKIINKVLGKDIKPKYVENPLKNYVFENLADTTKAEKILGFKAKFSLEEGIKDYLKEEPPKNRCRLI